MNAPFPNVFCRNVPPTKFSYRDAVSEIILNIQGERTDWDLGEKLGCSDATISNARRKIGNLDGVTLARIGHEFGIQALDPFNKLAGGYGVPSDTDQYIQIIDVVPEAMEPLSVVSKIARDGKVCHTERAGWLKACTRLAHIFVPHSSAGRAV